MPKLESYKGYEIMVDGEGEFSALLEGEEVCSANTLDAVKEKLNKLVKMRLNIPAYADEQYVPDSYAKGRITSCQEKRHYGGGSTYLVFRFVQDGGRHWQDKEPSRLYKVTKQNEKTIIAIKQLGEEISQKQSQLTELRKTLEAFTEEELTKQTTPKK